MLKKSSFLPVQMLINAGKKGIFEAIVKGNYD
jgi:hypothetical protein